MVLLDEIEKANPEVFDLLLQLLGEGRLTDSLGRTADFTSAIIIMTSNLGVREAEGNLGFVPEADRSFAFTRAAERFFRPEFFNRLDRVIPFRKLTRDEMGRIARRLVNEVLAREGFGQRKCVLNVSADALERVIQAGYDPALGARAMKRAVERELTQPAAARLASLDVNDLTIVTVNASVNALSVSVQAPGWADKLPLDARGRVAGEGAAGGGVDGARPCRRHPRRAPPARPARRRHRYRGPRTLLRPEGTRRRHRRHARHLRNPPRRAGSIRTWKRRNRKRPAAASAIVP